MRIIIVKKLCFRNHGIIGENISHLCAAGKLPSSGDESQCIRLIKSYFCRNKKARAVVFLLLRSDYRYLIKCTSPITKLHCATIDSLWTLRKKSRHIKCNFALFHLPGKLSAKSNYAFFLELFNTKKKGKKTTR